MTSLLLTSLQEWFASLPQQTNIHAMPLKRPVVLVHNSLIEYDEEANRYYFLNCKNQKQFGLIVYIGSERYLLWFLPLKFVLAEASNLLQAKQEFQIKIIPTKLYQEMFDSYSQGAPTLEFPLTESVSL